MPFAIESKAEQGFDKIILRDLENNTAVEVIPSGGAILHAFNILYDDKIINVIDSYDNADDYTKNITAKGFKSSKLSPFACRIKNACFNFGGDQYTIEKFLLGKNAIHGLLFDMPFDIIEKKADEESAAVVLQYQYRSNEKGFPFQYDCIVAYELQ